MQMKPPEITSAGARHIPRQSPAMALPLSDEEVIARARECLTSKEPNGYVSLARQDASWTLVINFTKPASRPLPLFSMMAISNVGKLNSEFWTSPSCESSLDAALKALLLFKLGDERLLTEYRWMKNGTWDSPPLFASKESSIDALLAAPVGTSRAASVSQARMSFDPQANRRFGTHSPSMVCPHCTELGFVMTQDETRKVGVSGGKATAALLTGGLSLLATGLSRKERVTAAHCCHCGADWHF